VIKPQLQLERGCYEWDRDRVALKEVCIYLICPNVGTKIPFAIMGFLQLESLQLERVNCIYPRMSAKRVVIAQCVAKCHQ